MSASDALGHSETPSASRESTAESSVPSLQEASESERTRAATPVPIPARLRAMERGLLGGRYELRSLLGRGAIGEVWRAFDLKLRLEVALKFLKPELRENEGNLDLLRQEVRAARPVVSPNVCRIYELLEIDGLEAVSMEYIDGVTLGKVLRQRCPLPLGEARDLAVQMLNGLQAIHQAGLVHRDLKPDNVMITASGRVVLMDFGLAVPAAESPTDRIAGTPAYMSFEQTLGQPVDHRSDIFSMGVILAVMISCTRYSDREARHAFLEALHELPVRLPESPWSSVLLRALALDPADRHVSAQAFSRALEEVSLRLEGDEGHNPYPGLSAFTEADTKLFFGREAEVEVLRARLSRQEMLAVIGPSGVGKSSFLRAGLIPALPEGWGFALLHPGTDPFGALAQALGPAVPAGLDLVQALACWRQGNAEAVLILDQFEELFTLNSSDVQRSFSRLLGDAVAEASVRVLLSIRDDFLFNCQPLPELAPIFSEITPLGPPTGASLRRSLVQPALCRGYRFENEALVEAMLQEVEQERGALPLMTFAASRLWEARDRESGLLTWAAYREIAGVAGALALHAEATLQRIGPGSESLVREIFRNLVTAEGTRAVREEPELLSVFGPDRGRASDVLQALVGARLLTAYEVPGRSVSGTTSHRRIEVIHESLLKAWPRLEQWQAQDAELARLRDQLREAAHRWQERGCPKGLLWRDDALAELRMWRARYSGKLSEQELAFSRASFAEASRSQRQKRLLRSAGIAVLLAALAAASWINRQIQSQLLDSYQEQGRQELLAGRAMRAAVYLGEVYRQGDDSSVLRLLLGQAMRSVDVALVASFNHGGFTVNVARFSADGKRLVTASKGVRLWDLASRSVVSIVSPDDIPTAMDISHDGTRVAEGTFGPLKLWDTSTGRLLNVPDDTIKVVNSVQFSPDDLRMAVTTNSSKLSVLETQSGRLLLEIQREGIGNSAVFSPDGSRLLTSGPSPVAKVWDAKDGRLLMSLEGHTDQLRSVAYSPDGTRIVTAGLDRTAKIWDASSGRLIASLEGHRGSVTHVACSPDGAMLATVSRDKTIKLWDALTGRMLASVEAHGSYVWWCAFSPDSSQLVTSSYDSTTKVWSVANFGALDSEIASFAGQATSAEYSPDGKRILVAGGGNVARVLEAGTGKLLLDLRLSGARFYEVKATFSPDGRRIASCVDDREDPLNANHPNAGPVEAPRVWDATSGAELFALSGHQGDVSSVAFSPDGTRIVSASWDGTGRIWDAATGKELRVLTGHKGHVTWAGFSPDARLVLTASEDGTARLWDVATGQLLRVLAGAGNDPRCAAFSPDGRRILTGSADATVRVWDASSGSLLFTLDGHTGDIRACVFSPDGTWIATGSRDSSAKIWDANAGKLLLSLEGHQGLVNSVGFDPAQQRLITTGADGKVKIWDLHAETRSPAAVADILERQVPYRFDRGKLIPKLLRPANPPADSSAAANR